MATAKKTVKQSPAKTKSRHLLKKSTGAEMVLNFEKIIAKTKKIVDIPRYYDFDKSLFEFFLKNPETKTIRIYPALKEGKMCFVLTPVNRKGHDMYLPDPSEKTPVQKTGGGGGGDDDGTVGDMGSACPLVTEDPEYKQQRITLP